MSYYINKGSIFDLPLSAMSGVYFVSNEPISSKYQPEISATEKLVSETQVSTIAISSVEKVLDDNEMDFLVGDQFYEISTTYTSAFINAIGVVTPYNGGYVTDKMLVYPGESVMVYGKANGSARAYALYDQDDKPVAWYPTTTVSGDQYISKEVLIPEGVKYIRASTIYVSPTVPKPKVRRKNLSKNYEKTIEDVRRLQYDVKHSFDVGDYVDASGEFVISSGYYITSDGIAKESGTTLGKITEVLDLETILDYYFSGSSYYGNACMLVYDTMKMLLGNLGKSSGGNPYKMSKFKLSEVYDTYPTAKYVRFGSYIDPLYIEKIDKVTNNEIYSELKDATICRDGKFESVFDYNINVLGEITHGYLNGWGRVEGSSGVVTPFIEINAGDAFKYASYVQWAAYSYVVYDNNKKFVAAFGKDTSGKGYFPCGVTVSVDEILTSYPNVKYIRFCSLTDAPNGIGYLVIHRLNRFQSVTEVSKYISEYATEHNQLGNKTYVAAGDSFTEGVNFHASYTDPEGHTGYASDAFDPLKKQWKTYPYVIGERNNMTVYNISKSGQTIYDPNLSGGNRFCSLLSNYQDIITSADYMTLQFGLNENSAPDGNPSDTSLSTEWGAWNYVLNTILTWNPDIKLGIIMSDSYYSDARYEHQKAVAEAYGIPYIDLKSTDVPPMIGQKRGNKMKSEIMAKYDAVNKDSSGHPTPASHRTRSNVIEKFLRGL